MNKFVDQTFTRILMKQTSIIVLIFFLLVSYSFAKPGTDAKQIFKNSKRNLSLINVHLFMDVKTFDKKGIEKSKSLEVSFAEFNEQKKVLISILAPENMSGMKILSTDYLNKKGIIEIYMPATDKIQKIRAGQHHTKILESGVPINIFRSIVDDNLKYTIIGEETIQGKPCYKIKIGNTEKNREYKIACVSKEQNRLLSLKEFDNRKNIIMSTVMANYQTVTNPKKLVYPKEIEITNFKTGKRSIVKIKQASYLFNAKIDDFKLNPKNSSNH